MQSWQRRAVVGVALVAAFLPAVARGATLEVGTTPTAIVADPNRPVFYVANYGSDSISVINASWTRVLHTVALGPGAAPGAMTLQNDHLWIVGSGGVYKLEVTWASLDEWHPFVEKQMTGYPGGPWGIARSFMGTKLFVPQLHPTPDPLAAWTEGASLLANRGFLHVRRVDDFRTVAEFPVGAEPWGIAWRYAGGGVYGYDEVWVANNDAGTVSVIRPDTRLVDAGVITIPVAPQPRYIAMGGNRAYVSHYGGEVSVIDTATRKVVAVLTTPAQANGISVNASGSALYVGTEGGVVTAFTLAADGTPKESFTPAFTGLSDFQFLDGGVVAGTSRSGATATLTSELSSPVGVTANARSGAADVTWSAPSAGDPRITAYTVTSSPGGRQCTGTARVLRCAVTGLTNGTTYTFTVTATNAAGTGPASAPSNPVTPGVRRPPR